MCEKFFIAAMSNANGFGNRSIAALLKFFGSAKVAWSAEKVDLIQAGVKPKPLQAFLEFRKDFPDAPDEVADYCGRHNINLCSFLDEDYPPLLKKINSPPMCFYYRGSLKPLTPRISIVGARICTFYGQKVASELGEHLAGAGFTIVSGAARGIDSFAHCSALRAGRTVAVLGCGLDYKCSRERENFLAQIAENGVVLSELNPQLAPTPATLAARNRIIAGLSRVVIVVEAGIKSGSMITANYATNFGREVFAVSNSPYPDYRAGFAKLVSKGAIPISNVTNMVNRYVASRMAT